MTIPVSIYTCSSLLRTCFKCQQASAAASLFHASVFTPGILFLISHWRWRFSTIIIVWHFTNATRKWVSSWNAKCWEVSSRWAVWFVYETSNSFSELKREEKQHFRVIKKGYELWSQKAQGPWLLAGRASADHGTSLNFSFFLCETGMLGLTGFHGSSMKGCMCSVQSQAWYTASTP